MEEVGSEYEKDGCEPEPITDGSTVASTALPYGLSLIFVSSWAIAGSSSQYSK